MWIVILIVIVALYVWYKKTHYHDTPYVKERIKGRDKKQQIVIRYFCNDEPCLSKKLLTDQEYEDMLVKELESHDFKQMALNKIGLDEDQVKEIEPVHFEGYVFDDNAFQKCGKDKLWRSSKYQVSWLFFSDTQVYVYQYTFFMDEDGKQERTEEYFYKDVTNFSSVSETEELPTFDPAKNKMVLENVHTNRFAITVPGDRFYCALKQNQYTEAAIQGMKAKLREKKSV